MKKAFKIVLALSAFTMASHAMAQITLYEHDGWRGRAFSTNGQVNNLSRSGFNDLASSVVIDGGQWEVCDDRGFGGRCMVLRRGSYESLGSMGMNDRISSLRPIERRDRYSNEAPAPLPQPTYEYRRRPNERIYEAQVVDVRAVVGQSGERCWVERQEVNEPSRANPAGTIVGALIGGVLGHQVGGGTGRDLATAGGAVAGAVIGSRAGNNNGGGSYSQDVRRCETTVNNTPEYWDVTYIYRGTEHRIQMSAPRGGTIAVNRNGEPRQ